MSQEGRPAPPAGGGGAPPPPPLPPPPLPSGGTGTGGTAGGGQRAPALSSQEFSAFMSLLRPILLFEQYGSHAVTASTSIFTNNLVPSNPPSILRITVIFDTSVLLTGQRFLGSQTKNPVQGDFNGASLNLLANKEYTFDMMMDVNESMNLIVSANANALLIKVWELQAVTG